VVHLGDLFILVLICLTWALSDVLSKVVFDASAVPPLFYAALRFAAVALGIADLALLSRPDAVRANAPGQKLPHPA